MKKILVFLSIIAIWQSSIAQIDTYKIQINIPSSYSNISWSQFVQKVEKNYPVKFYYKTDDFPDFQVNFDTDSIQLEELLTDYLLQYNIFFSSDRKGNIFLSKNSTIRTKLPLRFFKTRIVTVENEDPENKENNLIKTTRKFTTESVIVGTKEDGIYKRTATITGRAINSITGKSIPAATIVDIFSGKGVVTDESGHYKIKLYKGKHIFRISSVNIVQKQIEVDLRSDGVLDLILDDKIVLLNDVIVSAKIDNNIEGTQMGFDNINAKKVKKIPLVFGEKDILKVALLLPGVQSVGEGTAGFNVRGSPTDQNIFYINHLPIYNTSHLSGFFSAFNADIVDEFSLYKNNIPLQYGGRVSSVFEIKSREGNLNKITARGGIGPITGRLTVEGPLKKEKSSFLVGIRSTYSDWILNFIKDPIINKSKAQFSDAVTNFSFQLDEYNHLNVFTYFSFDKMDLFSQSKYNYQNAGISAAWKHFFKDKNSFDLIFAHSKYKFAEENNQLEIASFIHQNDLNHSELKAIFNIVPKEGHNMKIGINSTLYNIDKGTYDPLTINSYIISINIGKEKGIENGIFISDEWKVKDNLTLSGGLRYNLYTYFGEQDVNQYKEGLPYIEENIVSVVHYNNWEAIKTYGGLDYRFSANYLINDNLSIKTAYNRLHQFIFMLNNTIAVSPNYRWKLSDYNTKPIVGDQISLGLYSNLWQARYEFSVESYYKFSQNVVEIKDGANLIFNKNTEQATLQGNLNAYGLEFMIKKKSGKLTGWLNYTYSNSSVLVNSSFSENQINYGEPYPSNYDKPHAINLVASYDFSRRVAFSTNMVYSTGRPITYPTSSYYYGGIPTLNYSGRNEYRIPDYFRVDVSLNVEGNLLKRKLGHGTWAFSIYNVLGRKNTFSVYFKENDGLIKAYKLSIFGAPIFSVSYNFKLGNYESD